MLVTSSLGRLRIVQAEGDVLEHGHVLEGGVMLEDEADASLLRGRPVTCSPRMQILAGVGNLEPGDHAAAASTCRSRGPSSAVS